MIRAAILAVCLSALPPEIAKEADRLKSSLSDAERAYVSMDAKKLKDSSFPMGGSQKGDVFRLVRFQLESRDGVPVGGYFVGSVKVNQIIDVDSMLIEGNRYLLEGVKTAGIADDSSWDSSGTIVYCAGTTSYATSSGSQRTVKHLIALETDRLDKIAKQLKELESYREWTPSDGSPKYVARFIEFKNGMPLLQKFGVDTPESVPGKSLSTEDHKWMREEAARRAAIKKEELKAELEEKRKRQEIERRRERQKQLKANRPM